VALAAAADVGAGVAAVAGEVGVQHRHVGEPEPVGGERPCGAAEPVGHRGEDRGPVLTPWWTDKGGAADIIAAKAGTDRDSVLNSVGPELMGLATGRLVDPQEIADVVALLVSPRSASTTGSEFAVDAGFLKEL
jgi:hypothetical protein